MTEQIIALPKIGINMYLMYKHTHTTSCTKILIPPATHGQTQTKTNTFPKSAITRLSDLVYWSPVVRGSSESMASHKRQHYSLSAGAKHKVTFTLLPHGCSIRQHRWTDNCVSQRCFVYAANVHMSEHFQKHNFSRYEQRIKRAQ